MAMFNSYVSLPEGIQLISEAPCRQTLPNSTWINPMAEYDDTMIQQRVHFGDFTMTFKFK